MGTSLRGKSVAGSNSPASANSPGRGVKPEAQAVQAAQAQRLLRARIRLALMQPFLASAVMRLPLRAMEGLSWCKTAATDGYHIFYNPSWVSTLSDAELRGLLAHEVLHVLFAHSRRRSERDPPLWNVACDYAINLLLDEQGFRLPVGGLLSDEARGKTAEQIYDELKDQLLNQKGQGKWPAARSGEPDIRDIESAGSVPAVGDDLLSPDDPRVRPARSPDAPDAEQLEELRRELRQDAVGKLQGQAQHIFKTECQAEDDAKLDWKAVLRSWLVDRVKGDWSTFPFSKRMVHRGLFMPSASMQIPHHVVFAIDTSGSMQIEVLRDIAAELRAFRETFPCRLSVVQCDSKIRKINDYEAMDGYAIPQDLEVLGRGGTDFRPVFDWVREHAQGAVVLFATDADGSFPNVAPSEPVIWLLTPRHAPIEKIPFGAVVVMRGR